MEQDAELETEIPKGTLTETQVWALHNGILLDRYGFSMQDKKQTQESSNPSDDPQLAASRAKKWSRMLGTSGARMPKYLKQKPAKVKRRMRKGIPDECRSMAWFTLSGGAELLSTNMGVYDSLCNDSNIDTDVHITIIKDLHRTFPMHIYYMDNNGPGQRSLYKVLKAYAVHDPEVGYVQGMAFIVAVLLLYMPEERAFWTLVAMMKGQRNGKLPGLARLFQPGMPLLQEYLFEFDALFAHELPELAEHFKDQGISSALFTVHWFNTVFAYSLPFPHLLRVWDIFMLEGSKILFRVGVALLRAAAPTLKALPFEELMGALGHTRLAALLPSPGRLIKAALKVRVTQTLEKAKKEYQAQQKK